MKSQQLHRILTLPIFLMSLLFTHAVFAAPLNIGIGLAEELVIIDLATGTEQASIASPGGWKYDFHGVEVSNDGRYAVAFSDGNYSTSYGFYTIIDIASGKIINTLNNRNTTNWDEVQGIERVIISPDNRTAIGVAEDLLIIDLVTGTKRTHIESPLGYRYDFDGIEISNDGRYAVAFSRGTSSTSYGFYTVIDLTTGLIINTLDNRNTSNSKDVLRIHNITISPDNLTAVGMADDLLIIDLATGTKRTHIESPLGHHYDFDGIEISNDGRYAVAFSRGSSSTSYGFYTVIDLTTGLIINTLDNRNTSNSDDVLRIHSITISPDNLTAVGMADDLLIIDLATGTKRTHIESPLGHHYDFDGIEVSNDGRYAVAFSRGTSSTSYGFYTVIDLTTGLIINTLSNRNTSNSKDVLRIHSITISPDNLTAVGMADDLLIIDLATGTKKTHIESPLGFRYDFDGIEVSNDGRYAVAFNQGTSSTSYGFYTVIDLTTGLIINTINRFNASDGGVVQRIRTVKLPQEGLFASIDTVAPMVSVPADLILEATSALGAIVDYPAATATDNIGVVDGPVCTPAAGTQFAIGQTLVTCSAADAAGNIGSATFVITVQDTTAPQTTIDLAVDGLGQVLSSGDSTLSDVIELSFSAVDLVGVAGLECSLDRAVFSACTSPADFTALALGAHTFEVRGFDSAGNIDVTPAIFSWTVQTADEALEDFIEIIDGLPPTSFKNKNRANALMNKLNAVIDLINTTPPQYQDALDKLQSDILKKTDGCATSSPSTPDNNDWISDCAVQAEVMPLVQTLIAYLQTQL